MNTKRGAVIVLGVLIVLVLTAMTVMAASPHFIRASASVDNAGDLVVSWKEAGLGNNQLIDYLASADATGFYACINGGGKHPQAANKEAFEGPVSGEGTFSSGKNGQITASLTVPPPAPTLDCPPGQRLVLACVTYSDITLEDQTNLVYADVPGSISRTFFPLPECP
jgi:hypothetical protein